MSDIKQKAIEEFTEEWEKSNTWDSGKFGSLSEISDEYVEFDVNMEGIADFWLEKIDQAIQEDRERIVKLIKERGLHLGYANDIINIIREN